jgi:tight adherence protein B
VSGTAWALAAALLATAAVVAAWPARTVIRRLQARRPRSLPAVSVAGLWARIQDDADRRPRRALGIAALSGAMAGLLLAGPVASLVLGAYGTLGMRAMVRRIARRRAAITRARSLDELSALAADLRAGLPPAAAVSPQAGRLAQLTAAVWRLAERTGAPVADLVERIEADARAYDRSRATALAQAAGAQATALLLAGLPVGGIGLGYSVGVDPLEVLLHTPVGAACAVGAVVLQSAGLLWADRLTNGAGQ